MNIAQHLELSARHHANRPALIAGERQWTYRELDEAASALAGGFAALGLKPGERLGLHLPNWPEFVLAYWSVKAFVVLQESKRVTAEALQTLCRDAIASYKVPETIEFVSGLPKNPTGKILKKELRQRAALE